jgi:hypothetical protein
MTDMSDDLIEQARAQFAEASDAASLENAKAWANLTQKPSAQKARASTSSSNKLRPCSTLGVPLWLRPSSTNGWPQKPSM